MSAGSHVFARSPERKLRWPYDSLPYTATLFADGALIERAVGRAVGLKLRASLESLPAESVLLIDLRRLHRADFFALRELIMALEMTCGRGRVSRYRAFAVDPSHTETLETLELIARDRDLLLPLVNAVGEWRFIGRLTAMERETLAIVLAAGTMTAAEISLRCSIPISAASNRLRRLHMLCLIRRRERAVSRGGREFLYSSLLAPP